MRIPKQVSILGRKFKVKQVDPKVIQRMHSRAIGLCDVYNQVIYLDKTLPQNAKERTYLHELAHGYMDTVGIDQTLNSNEIEILAQSLASFMYGIIKK